MPDEDTESIEDSWRLVRPDRNEGGDPEPACEEAAEDGGLDSIGVDLLPNSPYERSVIWVAFLWRGQEVPGGRVRAQLPELTVSDPENHPEGEFQVEGEFYPTADCYIDSINLYLCEHGGPPANRNRNSNIVFRVSHERGLAFSFRLRRGLNAEQLRVLVVG